MTKLNLRQIIREEVSKVLKEGKIVKLKFDLTVYPRKHRDPNQPNKITIPAGESIEIIEHPFAKQAQDSWIKYKDQDWVVGKSTLDNALWNSLGYRG